MNFGEILSRARILLDDSAQPYLWTDAEILYNANEAQREAAIRADLVKDDSLTIPIVSGIAQYELDPGCRIHYIDYVRLSSDSDFTLVQTSFDKLNRENRTVDWGDGTPVLYALDGVADTTFRSITLFPTPTAADTLLLSVKRLPFDMVVNNDTPEIDENWHPDLINWILHLCYRKHNPDTDTTALANAHEALFEKTFGPRIPIDSIRRRQTLVPYEIMVV